MNDRTPSSRSRVARGFTLLELILVLVVLEGR